jgi:hypothetical protein
MPEQDANALRSSLKLIHVHDLEISVFAPSLAFNNPKRRVQGKFSFDSVKYALWVTDPTIEREFKAKDDGKYPVGKCFLTVSIGEPHNGFCYKLIAAVIRTL